MKIVIYFKIVFICLLLATSINLIAQEKDLTINVHLRGVWESQISLLALSGPHAGKPIVESLLTKGGQTASLTVGKDQVPGEFVLRFDYKDKETSNSYPSEKHIFINNQDLELWINPPYCNNSDSTWFQKGEVENTLFAQFSKDNLKQKEKIGALQNFLMSYDDNNSTFYKSGIAEYEKRRLTYNQWLASQTKLYKTAFVSSSFRFQYIPLTEWKENLTDRMQSLISHYFDGMDFKDANIIKTADMTEWMNKYVNIYGALSTTKELRDSLFPLAAKKAIDKARLGDPTVYGWMVDYFYNGFEANNIPSGITALQTYLDDPNCLTNKKQQTEKRLAGMKTLLIGSLAPDFTLKDDAGHEKTFVTYPTDCKYKLVLFWSSSCDHCKEVIKILYPWYQQLSDKKLIKIFALGMDDTEHDIKLWEKVHPLLEGWNHSLPSGGINSKVANAYFILSTPVMILVDSQTNKILAIPETMDELDRTVK